MSTHNTENTPSGAPVPLTKKDFVTDQEVRWCPGCGDYAILATVQGVMPELGVPRENIVFISGIGCAARFPYYMQTYGMHSIHGRAPAIATGLAASRPDLSVWVVGGDGDMLSIGGNHLIHALRRNVNLNILMFNNQVYGLTKGQYSPTSPRGQRSGSTPLGSIDQPFNPLGVAIGAEATFVARAIDTDRKHVAEVLRRAAAHPGTAFVEILQNCNIFNDGAFSDLTEREVKADHQLVLESGKPLVFGKDRDRGIRLNGLRPEVVSLRDVPESEILIHDEKNPVLAYLLAHMTPPSFPTPIGVLFEVDRPAYEQGVHAQIEQAVARGKGETLEQVIATGDVWTVS